MYVCVCLCVYGARLVRICGCCSCLSLVGRSFVREVNEPFEGSTCVVGDADVAVDVSAAWGKTSLLRFVLSLLLTALFCALSFAISPLSQTKSNNKYHL